MEQILIKFVLYIFFYLILVSANNNNSSLSETKEVQSFSSSGEIENVDNHSNPGSSYVFYFWIISEVLFGIALLIACCCWAYRGFGMFSNGPNVVHPGYAYGGYGYLYDRYGHPIMPYPHQYVNQPGLNPYNDPYATPGSYQYHMNLANRYDRQQQQQIESQQNPTQESSFKEQKNVNSSPLMTNKETNVTKQTESRTSESS